MIFVLINVSCHLTLPIYLDFSNIKVCSFFYYVRFFFDHELMCDEHLIIFLSQYGSCLRGFSSPDEGEV